MHKRILKKFYIIIVLLAISLIAPVLGGENWTNYRGNRFDGSSDVTGLPLTWSLTENITWQTEIHDRGHSSPVIWGNQVWLTTAAADGQKMYVLCIDRTTGKILLDQLLFSPKAPEEINALNSYASPSPVIEAGRVYISFGTYGTTCIDTKTFKQLWIRSDINCTHEVGAGSSPVLYQDKLILTMDGNDVQYLIALDKATGKTVWKTTRTTDYLDLKPLVKKAFSTPRIITYKGEDQLVSVGARNTMSLNPHTGEPIWKIDKYKGFSAAWMPATDGEHVYVNTGYGTTELIAIKLGGKGDITNTHVTWRKSKGFGHMSSPLLINNRLYVMSDESLMGCIDTKTGNYKWKTRMKGKFSAASLYVGGHIYTFSREGKTVVYKPGDTFEQRYENQLDASGLMATPAIAGKAFFIRTGTTLYRIEK